MNERYTYNQDLKENFQRLKTPIKHLHGDSPMQDPPVLCSLFQKQVLEDLEQAQPQLLLKHELHLLRLLKLIRFRLHAC